MSRPWPLEVRVKRSEHTVAIAFDDGQSFVLPAEYLRVMTGSALDRGHGEARAPVAGKQAVGVAEITPIGRYAVRIRFDDGHDTGLYSWDALYELGRDHEQKWGQYLTDLESHGLSR
ncbi:MAG TPA: gamma-butyrobetaine hydroxylase-like domain-containing protein [Caulobacteraceae bacterium]